MGREGRGGEARGGEGRGEEGTGRRGGREGRGGIVWVKRADTTRTGKIRRRKGKENRCY